MTSARAELERRIADAEAEHLDAMERRFTMPAAQGDIDRINIRLETLRSLLSVTQPQRRIAMTNDQIKHMVDRFLGWRLPADFHPDCGISFKADFNEHTPHPMKNEPIGTNLFDATQAEAMVRHMLEGLPRP